jgi:hypothetical protein
VTTTAEKDLSCVRGFFPKDEIALLHREAKEVFALQMRRLGILPADGELPADGAFDAAMVELFNRDLQTFTNCGKQAQHLISLHRFSLDQRIVQALNELGLEFPNISTRPLLYFNAERLAKKEVYWRLDAHQDWRSMQGSLDSMVVWLPLVDINQDLGALEVIPGSHRWGLLNANFTDGYGHVREPVDRSQFISVEVVRGDALFFSSLLLHQSGTNVTNSIRWSCHFRYNNLADETFIERGFPHPYLYKPQEELITPDFPSRDQVEAVFNREANGAQ